MVVGVERRRGLGLRGTDREPLEVDVRSFEARPSEIAGDRAIRDPVDLLPGARADVRDEDFVRAGFDDHAKRIAEAVADDAALVGVAAAEHRVIRQSRPGGRVHAEDRAAQDAGLSRRSARALAAQGTPFRARLGLVAPDGYRRIAAGVLGRRGPRAASELTPVGVREASAFSAADVELAVGAEREGTDRVAGELLTPVLDQDLLARGPVRADRMQTGEVSADDAPVRRRPGRRRARIRGAVAGAPPRSGPADRGVMGVQNVDVVVRCEVGIDREAEQAPIPEVVHLRPQVGHDRRSRGCEAVVLLDEAALLGHEHAAVRQESQGRRIRQPGEDRRFMKRRLLV